MLQINYSEYNLRSFATHPSIPIFRALNLNLLPTSCLYDFCVNSFNFVLRWQFITLDRYLPQSISHIIGLWSEKKLEFSASSKSNVCILKKLSQSVFCILTTGRLPRTFLIVLFLKLSVELFWAVVRGRNLITFLVLHFSLYNHNFPSGFPFPSSFFPPCY